MSDISEMVKKLISEQSARLEARAKIALLFYPADQLTWVYHQGRPLDDPDLRVKDVA